MKSAKPWKTFGESGIQITTTQFVKEILSNHGFRGLFNGLVPRLLKVSPACAIVMSTYEYCKIQYAKKTLNKTENTLI